MSGISGLPSALENGTVIVPANELVGVGRVTGPEGKLCTGTLVSDHAVLTAGHCVQDGASATFTLPNNRGAIVGTAVQHPLYNTLHYLGYDYPGWNNSIGQIWVKQGRHAQVFPKKSYLGGAPDPSGSPPFWTSRTYDGYTGNWCNEHGCLHDLEGTVAERTASSIKCY